MNTCVFVQIHTCDFNIIYEEYTYNDPIITQKWGYPHLCEHMSQGCLQHLYAKYTQISCKYHANWGVPAFV